MKIGTTAALAAFLMIAASGCTTMTVYTDYDHTASFSGYDTFEFLGQPKGLSPLMQRRARDAVRAELTAKGLRRARGPRADLHVAINARIRVERQLSTVHFGYGYRWWGGHVGMAHHHVRNVPVGAVVVDLVDARTNQLVWRGVAHDVMSRDPERNAATIREAVSRMFAEFPPR